MKKYLIFFLVIVGVFSFTILSKQSLAVTLEELQSQLQQLLEAIRALQSQTPATTTPSPACPFVSIMYLGYSEEPTDEVRELQRLLSQLPGIYPEGLITGYFGKLTDAALRRFQRQYGLPITGQTNAATRAKLCVIWQNQKRIGQCGWCGADCVRITSGMNCPPVTPPLGVECKEVNGVCTKVPKCTDSDGGKNYNVKGTVTYNGKTYTDQCIGSPTVLREYYCENNEVKYIDYSCPRCQDGACKLPTPDTIPPTSSTTLPPRASMMDILAKLSASLMSLMELLKR